MVASLACLSGAAAAQASDRVYWPEAGKIVFANVDGSGEVQTLPTGSTTIGLVEGAAIDPATNRIYWINRIGNEGGRKILFANLDGSGGGELNIAGTDSEESTALAIDPVGRKIYWGGRSSGNISFAHLDGSGGGILDFANTNFPSGVAVDPVARRLYWVNATGPAANGVSWANLDGPGEGSVPIGTAPRNDPQGAAIDPVTKRIFWANLISNQISFANLDESGGGALNTAGATVSLAAGIAVDPVAGHVYWANRAAPAIDGAISFANSDGSGGGRNPWVDLPNSPQFPLLLYGPQATSPPAISGGTGPGSQLACSTGAWAADATEAFFYRSPNRFGYQWSRNGADLPGATSPTLAAAPTGGEYRCRVTAANAAGSASQATPPHRVAPARGNLALKLAVKKVRPGAPLRVAILNTGPVDVAGSLSGRGKVSSAGKRRFAKLAGKPFQVAAGARVVVQLRLPKPLRLQLLSRHKLPVKLNATFAVPGGPQQATQRSLTPRLRQPKAPSRSPG